MDEGKSGDQIGLGGTRKINGRDWEFVLDKLRVFEQLEEVEKPEDRGRRRIGRVTDGGGDSVERREISQRYLTTYGEDGDMNSILKLWRAVIPTKLFR